MARSVSHPRDAVVAYVDGSDFSQDDFDFFVEDFTSDITCMWPSTYEQDGWHGREDRIVARNRFVSFGVSEYCGLIAVWAVVDIEEHNHHINEALADNWLALISDKFKRSFGELRSIGHASNGEHFLQRIEA